MKSVRRIGSISSGNSWCLGENKLDFVLISSKYAHLPIVLNITVIDLIANNKYPSKTLYIYDGRDRENIYGG